MVFVDPDGDVLPRHSSYGPRFFFFFLSTPVKHHETRKIIDTCSLMLGPYNFVKLIFKSRKSRSEMIRSLDLFNFKTESRLPFHLDLTHELFHLLLIVTTEVLCDSEPLVMIVY